MRKILLLILVCGFMFSFCACASTKKAEGNNSTVKENETVSDNNTKISTPYTDLEIKKTTLKNISYEVTSENPYTLTFKTKKDGTELFSFVFDGTGDNLIGTITGKDKNIVVYMNVFDLDSNSENYEEYSSYQMAMNDIANSLLDNKNFVSGEVIEYEDNSTFDIKTNIVTLKYPNKWKNKVNIDVSDEAVIFTFKDTKLFDIYFKDIENGSKIGTYDKTPIFVISYLPDDNRLSEEEMNEYTEMQYDINEIVNNLKKDKKFKISD